MDIQVLKKIDDEITGKKMVPIARIIKVLENHGEYCDVCGGDEPTIYYDPSKKAGPALRCPFCGYSVKWETVIKRALNMPYDYLERLITGPAKNVCVDRIGNDTWIYDGYCAELAGPLPFSYPDRDKFKVGNAISKILEGLDIGLFEEAQKSKVLYREMGYAIAALESPNHKAYINERYAEHIYGIYTPYICGPLGPVLVRVGDRICKIIMPIRKKEEAIYV